ncbi:MAG TPA: tRNA (adenosine(37)-N6)-dimethylallyltransferase MiaA [Cyclobacteriaceae bacterium]
MVPNKRKKLIVIVGPTAVGKTEVAIQLAEYLRTEIVSADSRQIFKELTIGTAKPSLAELARVPHHFIGNKSIHEEYDAGQYGRDALELTHQLFHQYDQIVLCGGSGLYVKAVCEGFDDLPEVPDGTRERIIESYEQLGLEWLQTQLKEKDPDYFLIVDQKNPHRLIRALELIEATQQPIGALRKQKKIQHDFDIVKVGLELDREELYSRIDERMDKMIETGLFEEAKSFYSLKELNSLQTVGYREIFDYLDGLYDREEAVRLLKRNTRRYAKRQLTWFKKDLEVQWFQPSNFDRIKSYVSESSYK